MIIYEKEADTDIIITVMEVDKRKLKRLGFTSV